MSDSSGSLQSDAIAPIRAAVAGRYEITREIGQGAFATVYLARDLRHDRDVAFKVLNADPSSETGELRFLREIRVLAKLQHPNILPLIDSGHAEAMLYYVMPFVSGESLRGRMNRERHFPLDTAMTITREAADALASAHEHGIIHRDIKPENILLAGNRPIIADFGIARAIDLAGVRQLTRTGFGSPGTPAYMSPEQLMAEGEVDQRTDIYSLGCVFYEMLTGKPPFAGKDGFVRRFTEAPPLPSLSRAGLPVAIDSIVSKALARDPNDRYATAADFAAALATADLSVVLPSAPGMSVGRPTPRTLSAPAPASFRPTSDRLVLREPAPVVATQDKPSGLKPAWRVVAIGAALALLVAIALAWPSSRRSVTADARSRRWDIVLPDSAPLAFVGAGYLGIGSRSLTLSPDGDRIVYAARRGSTTELYTRELDKLDATRLPGTDHAYLPFFSPDGKWLAFFADTYLKKVGIPDGEVVTLARVSQPMGGIWTTDGRIIVADNGGGTPSFIPEAGGVLSPLRFEKPISHPWRYPQLLPDGEWVLHTDIDGSLNLTSMKSGRAYAITSSGVTRRDSTDVTQLIFGTSPIYVSTGHIVYLSSVGGVLMALPFDATTRKVLGQPVPILNGIREEAEAGAGQFAIARDGTLLYAPGRDAGRSVLVSLDGQGKLDTLPFRPAGYQGFEIAPDGNQILIRIQSESGRPELWVLDIDKGSQTRIRTEGVPYDIPRWWPDSRQIVYAEFAGEGGYSPAPFVRQRIDGLSKRDTLVAAAGTAVPAPDGHHIAVTGWKDHPGTWLLPTDGSTDKPVQLVSELVYFTTFSPDGKWIAYAAPDPLEIYASSVERPQERYKISSAGGEEPIWSPKGDRIVYRIGQQWLAVDVSTVNGFKAGKAHVIFEGPYLNVPGWSHSFFPDGQRQLLLLGPQEQTSIRLVAVTNWFTELARLAPSGRN